MSCMFVADLSVSHKLCIARTPPAMKLQARYINSTKFADLTNIEIDTMHVQELNKIQMFLPGIIVNVLTFGDCYWQGIFILKLSHFCITLSMNK
jgi:hypothetical protein